MKKEIVIPQYTWDEFEKLVLANIQDEYSRGDIELIDLLKAPPFSRGSPQAWIEWSTFMDIRPHNCIIWMDNQEHIFLLVNSHDCMLGYNKD